MKTIAAIIAGLLLSVGVVSALPPAPPTLDDLAQRSDLIAIIAVTNVTDHISTAVAWKKGVRQSAVATVKRTIQGTAPTAIRLTYQGPALHISCRPPGLDTGEFIIFLKRDGKEFVRTDFWYSQAVIVANQVSLFAEQPESLESALTKIQKVVTTN